MTEYEANTRAQHRGEGMTPEEIREEGAQIHAIVNRLEEEWLEKKVNKALKKMERLLKRGRTQMTCYNETVYQALVGRGFRGWTSCPEDSSANWTNYHIGW